VYADTRSEDDKYLPTFDISILKVEEGVFQVPGRAAAR
jgi:hypothetical protein